MRLRFTEVGASPDLRRYHFRVRRIRDNILSTIPIWTEFIDEAAEHSAHVPALADHELTRDFRLEDVWALPTPGGPGDFPRLVDSFPGLMQGFSSDDPSLVASLASRTLWSLRWKVGGVLGWD